MDRGNLSRRGFLQRSLAGLTIGAGLPLWFAREVLAEKEAYAGKVRRRIGPNDRVQIGAIGIGSPGGRNTPLLRLKSGILKQLPTWEK